MRYIFENGNSNKEPLKDIDYSKYSRLHVNMHIIYKMYNCIKLHYAMYYTYSQCWFHVSSM